MKSLDEIAEALAAWIDQWAVEPPRDKNATRDEGLSLEDAARIAPEGYHFNKLV